MGEDELVQFLQRFGSAGQSASKVKFDRRRAALDDDEDFWKTTFDKWCFKDEFWKAMFKRCPFIQNVWKLLKQL